MPRAASPLTAAVTPPTYVERTALPRISVRSRGASRYSAYVQSYVAGPSAVLNGANTTSLFSLSLLAMRGHGAVLRGLWSALIANHVEEITIDGLDQVALAHHILPAQRYQLHWNYSQETLDTGELQATVEAHMLTICDPVRAVAAKERPSRHQAKNQRKQRTKKVEAATMTKKEEMDEEEGTMRHLFPMFLVQVPGSVQPRQKREERDDVYAQRCQTATATWRANQHFAFLDQRYPWPLLPEWSAFLWQRGIASRETTRLSVWSPPIEQEAEGEFPRTLPIWLEAWLCRPDPLLIKLALDQAREHGDLPLPAWLRKREESRELAGSVS